MAIKIDRKKGNRFKKQHYVRLVRDAVSYLTHYFGYTKKPYLFETKNDSGTMMYIAQGCKRNTYGIFYDYEQFERQYACADPYDQEAVVMFIIAHEMRHYYQLRQINSKTPREDAALIEQWRTNDKDFISPEEHSSPLAFHKTPLELDASLFAYVFVAEELDALMRIEHFFDPSYIHDLEAHYVRLFGKTDEALFPKP